MPRRRVRAMDPRYRPSAVPVQLTTTTQDLGDSRVRVDAELERLRESVASLETVDRPAGDGDFVVLDFVGTVDGEPFEGGDARGYLLELGSSRLVPGFEDQLKGAKAGEEREVKVTFP